MWDFNLRSPFLGPYCGDDIVLEIREITLIVPNWHFGIWRGLAFQTFQPLCVRAPGLL